MQPSSSGCGQRPALWTTAGQWSAPRGQLAALDPPLPDEEGAAAAGVEEDEEDEPSFDDDEPSFDDDDDDVEDEALSDAVALLRLSVR